MTTLLELIFFPGWALPVPVALHQQLILQTLTPPPLLCNKVEMATSTTEPAAALLKTLHIVFVTGGETALGGEPGMSGLKNV